MRAPGIFTSEQALLLMTARAIFIFNQLSIFPLYYLPGLRGRLGADGKGQTKFPCSISWQTRKGLPRLSTILFWNIGWAHMARAFFKDGDFAAMSTTDWYRGAFMLQMYATGFVCIVLTPMKGRDVAMGREDALHCYAAMLYVADHAIANQFILGVPLTSFYGAGLAVTSVMCGICQGLRADDDHLSRRLYARMGIKKRMPLSTFVWLLEIGFMFWENAIFFVFLIGMSSGVHIVDPTPPSTSHLGWIFG
jgi:hypothetical protein